MNLPDFVDSPYTRRGFVQAGFAASLGLSLPQVLSAKTTTAKPARKRPKSVFIIFLTGGASHHETFDMKPDAPVEIRGQFKPIATTVPGLLVCEHLPKLASWMDRCALVRSMSHREENHLLATHQVLTGTAIPGGKFDQIASRNDWPCYASALDHLKPRSDGIPAGVTLPTFLMEGPLVWPGQHSGFLGPKHDPWHLKQDPNKPGFKVDAITLDDGPTRIIERHALLEQMNRTKGTSLAESNPLKEQQEKAFTILTSGKVSEAFDLARESVSVRDRYGRHMYGQSLLLGRRLIEAGIPIVQTNMGIVQTWDNHGDIFNTLKNRLLPPLDRGVSALLDDLSIRGLLDDTLVVMFGEFGRTPKVNGGAGRDHWGKAFFTCYFGGGVTGGAVIGKTDSVGGAPVTHPYSPMDLAATIYQALGVDHDVEIRDQVRRPVKLNAGKPIDAIYA